MVRSLIPEAPSGIPRWDKVEGEPEEAEHLAPRPILAGIHLNALAHPHIITQSCRSSSFSGLDFRKCQKYCKYEISERYRSTRHAQSIVSLLALYVSRTKYQNSTTKPKYCLQNRIQNVAICSAKVLCTSSDFEVSYRIASLLILTELLHTVDIAEK